MSDKDRRVIKGARLRGQALQGVRIFGKGASVRTGRESSLKGVELKGAHLESYRHLGKKKGKRGHHGDIWRK